MKRDNTYITRWLEPDLKEPSSYADGEEITNREWCGHEAARWRKLGIKVEILRSDDPYGANLIALRKVRRGVKNG